MKKSFLLIMLAFCMACGSKTSTPKVEGIPEMILTRFNALYPKVDHVVWKAGERKYTVSFSQKENEFAVVFEESGGVNQVKKKVEISTLPSEMTAYIAQNMAGQKLEEAWRAVDAFETVTWEVKVGTTRYVFASNGGLMGQMQPE